MKVKVKAKIVKIIDYDYKEKYCIKYTYKTKGFKKDTNYITVIYSQLNESHYDYDRRIIKELSLITKEEVVDNVKSDIVNKLKYRIATNDSEKEKERLLKELNNIKFTFTIKDKL